MYRHASYEAFASPSSTWTVASKGKYGESGGAWISSVGDKSTGWEGAGGIAIKSVWWMVSTGVEMNDRVINNFTDGDSV